MRALAVVVAIAGCAEAREQPPPAAAPTTGDPDGLRAHLAQAHAALGQRAADPIAAWEMPEAVWRAHVTPAYQAHWGAYRSAFAVARPALHDAIAAWSAGDARWQHADDPALTPAQVRLRWALPVGRPGVVADGVPAVFVHDGTKWRALVSLDGVVSILVDEAQPRCSAAAMDVATKRCAEYAAVITDAALRGDAGQVRRACAQAAAVGCGS